MLKGGSKIAWTTASLYTIVIPILNQFSSFQLGLKNTQNEITFRVLRGIELNKKILFKLLLKVAQ